MNNPDTVQFSPYDTLVRVFLRLALRAPAE
jgi:hypothetical protein